MTKEKDEARNVHIEKMNELKIVMRGLLIASEFDRFDELSKKYRKMRKQLLVYDKEMGYSK